MVGNAHDPALFWGWSGDGDITAEVDQHARPGLCDDGPGGPIGTEGLGRGAEVECHPGRHLHRRRVPIDPDRLPARYRSQLDAKGRPGDRHRREVPVIADGLQGATHCRHDESAGQPGRPQGGIDRFEEERRGRTRAATCRVEAGELAVGAEAAGGQVDGVEFRAQHGQGSVANVPVGQDDGRGRAQRRQTDRGKRRS